MKIPRLTLERDFWPTIFVHFKFKTWQPFPLFIVDYIIDHYFGFVEFDLNFKLTKIVGWFVFWFDHWSRDEYLTVELFEIVICVLSIESHAYGKRNEMNLEIRL